MRLPAIFFLQDDVTVTRPVEQLAMAVATLRPKCRKNYRELADIKLPKAKKQAQKSSRSQLYPVNVVERGENGRVKVHYIGFSHEFDEWREPSDIVPLELDERSRPEARVLLPFSLYVELGNAIKKALNSGRKESPHVRIEMAFDKLQFTGGLKACSTSSRTYRGIDRYKITSYKDLDSLLGKNWHVRGLNSNGDFCYVILNTLEFYLHKRKDLIEYLPTSEGSAVSVREQGYTLIFTFIRRDGTPDMFGKDSFIFC